MKISPKYYNIHSIEFLMLKDPHCINQLLHEDDDDLSSIRDRINQLIKIFDEKPIIETFTGKTYCPLDYVSALQYVSTHCKNKASDHKQLIKALSQAKGMPNIVSESQAQAFFV